MTAPTTDWDAWEREYNAKMDAAVAALDKRWGIRGYKAHNTRDGVAYVFKLTDYGVVPEGQASAVVAYVENSGRGGADMVDFIDRKGPSAEAFRAETLRLFGENGDQDQMVSAILTRAGK